LDGLSFATISGLASQQASSSTESAIASCSPACRGESE
jgi:hypothetical protein